MASWAPGGALGHNKGASTSTLTVTNGVAITSGDLLICCIHCTGTVSGVKDSVNGNYTLVATPTANGGGTGYVFYFKKSAAVSGGGATLTITFNANCDSTYYWEDYTGGDGSLDQTATFAGNTGNPSASITVTNTGDLLIFGGGNTQEKNGSSPTGGVTAVLNQQQNSTFDCATNLAYGLSATSGANTPSISFGGSFCNCSFTAATFLLNSAGGGGSSWNQSASDTQSAMDLLNNETQKNLAPDSQSGTDSTQNQSQKNLPSDATSALDGSTRQPSKNLPREVTSAIDGSLRQTEKTLAEWQVTWDTLLSKAVSKALLEWHSGGDAVAKSVLRTLLETFSETDSFQRMRGSLLTLTGDGHSGVDSATRQVGKLVADMASLLDGLSKATNKSLLDSFSTLDTLSKMPSHFLYEWVAGSDWLSGHDSVSETLTHFSGTSWNQTVTDHHSALDALLGKGITHYSTDFFSQLDVMSRVWIATLVLRDAFSGQDIVAKQMTHYVPADHQSALDFLTHLAGRIITIQDAHSAQDGVTKSVSVLFMDALSATDSQSKQMLRTLFEQMSQTDQTSTVRGILRYVTDAFSLTDSYSMQNLPPGGLTHLGMTIALVASALGLTIQLQALPAALGLLVTLLVASLATSVEFV